MKKKILIILLTLCIVMCLFTSCKEEIRCSHCKEEIIGEEHYDENGNIFCQSCHEELLPSEINEELTSDEIIEIKCPYCGETYANSEDNDGCPYCDEDIDDFEENKKISNEIPQKTSYENILSGDFSKVAGIYKTVSGNKIELLPNGASGVTSADNYKIEGIRALDNGSYNWTLAWYYDDEPMSAVSYVLYPEGVDVVAYDGSVLDTDTTKLRLWVSNIAVMNAQDAQYIYYKID